MKKKIIWILLGSIPFITGYTFDDTNISVTVWNVDVPVYDVNVSWGNMEFVYNKIINYEWNNTSFTYETNSPTYKWVSNSSDIKIENKSSFLIDVDLKYNSINSKINGNFDKPIFSLNKSESAVSKLNLNGKLSSDNTSFVKVGTIDLTIH